MSEPKAVLDRNNGVPKAETPPQPISTPTPDPEVVSVAQRRQFSRAYKLQILNQVDACTHPGEIGALLRAEGLYSSHLTKWRRQRENGELGTRKRGKKAVSPAIRELARLRADKARLQKKLEDARAIIEVQKKLSDLLGLSGPTHQKGDERGSGSHRS
jgi:transposase-like protein